MRSVPIRVSLTSSMVLLVLLLSAAIVTVKGKTRPARVFEPLGEAGAVPPERLAFARAYESAFEDCLARRLARAEATLAALAAPWRQDRSVERLRQAAERLAAEPPPADWDGVLRMASK